MIFAVLVVLIIGGFAAVLTSTLLSDSSLVRRTTFETQARQLAESGVDHGIWCLNHLAECGGTFTGETHAQGSGSYTTTVQTVGSDRILTTSGTVNGRIETVRVTASDRSSPTDVAFIYGVQVGIGGLSMSNTSSVVGNVYANGNIAGSSGTITGDATVAGGTTLVLDQQQTQFDTPFFVGQDSAHADAAQSFIAGSTNVLNKFTLYVRKQNLPGNATIRIAHDIGGLPATTAIGQGTLTAASVPITYAWVDVPIAAQPALVKGSRYWIIFDFSCAASCTNYYSWGSYSTYETSYPDGKAFSAANWTAGPWTDERRDFEFKVYLGGNTTELRSKTVQQNARARNIAFSTVTGHCYYQTIISTLCGTQHPGSPNSPQVDLPITKEQIDAWKAEAEAADVITPPGGAGSTYSPSSGTIGPAKIDGSLSLSGSTQMTLGGVLWVKGNLTMRNSAIIHLASSFGSRSGIIIVDDPDDEVNEGKISLANSSQILGSGTAGSYMLSIATNRSMNAGSPAVNVANSVVGSILYASQGIVSVANSVSLKEVTAQALSIANSATVTYESGIVSTEFSTGPGGVWAIAPQSWQVVH